MNSITESIAELVAEGCPEDVARLLVKADLLKRRKSDIKNSRKRAEIREKQISETRYPYAYATCAHPYKHW